MNLSKKFILWSGLLVCVVLTLGTISAWNLLALSRSSHASLAEYDALDRAEAATVQVAWLRDALRTPTGATYRDPQNLTPIRDDIAGIVTSLHRSAKLDDGDAATESRLATATADQYAD